MKYTIVIPTYNNCEKYLKPCVDSLIKWSTMEDIELVISANGCTDNTKAYLNYLYTSIPNLKTVWNDEPIGFAKAINEGIKVSTAEKIILLNNDVLLLEQQKNQWLHQLEAPFLEDDCFGISGIIKEYSEPANSEFLVFFCVMIDRKVFQKIGLLSEEFKVGGSEDTDFCIRAKNAGFKLNSVLEVTPTDNPKWYSGNFPIFHEGEGTMHDSNLVKNWNQTFLINSLRLAKKYNPEWYRWKLSNNYERAVFLKGDAVFPRETQRYQWANRNLYGKKILEIGCSTGYGVQFLPSDIEYVGLDYDQTIVSIAKEQNWKPNCEFVYADINTYDLEQYDTIIAFEVIEHLDNGLELAERLKKHCKRLLITCPWNEPKGFWGEHHKLHGLNESHFSGFNINYISEHGNITEQAIPISENNRCNLMIMSFTNE
jgi:glycosyltransferase involved in cell wall biosynthesis